jgi:ATP-dependent DNA helicase RecG
VEKSAEKNAEDAKQQMDIELNGGKSVEKSKEKNVEKILFLLKMNPHITQKELVKETGLSRRGIENNIRILKSKGIIARIGPDKGGYWDVIDNK